MDADKNIVLTIAVPTYNRAGYLTHSLTSILGQAGRYGDRIEVIVSDNGSTDQTVAVVRGFQDAGHTISFTSHPSNLGADANFLHCFREARGKYFLLFSDDDILLDGALDKLMPLLEGGDYGVVFMDVFFFTKDHLKEQPRRRKSEIVTYQDPRKFISQVNIWFTFISSNVVNKELYDSAIRLEDFSNTNLQQLGWTFPSLFKAKQNAHVNEFMVAAQWGNSGGYKFCEVFGKNLNQVFDIFTKNYGYRSEDFKIINRIILKRHLSKYILTARKDFGSFHQENFLEILHPTFKGYLSYWLFIYPSIKWPLPLAKLWCKVSRRIARMTGTFN
jgi:abequosyltransferase